MERDLGRILNVLAHEIRTPLAVSQGYLKLMAEGRLDAATEQAKAIERTRTALGKIAALCTEMGRLGGLSELPAARLHGRVAVSSVITGITEGLAPHAPVRSSQALPDSMIATDGTHDLAAAVAALGTMVCADAGPEEKVMTISGSSTSVTLVLGSAGAVAALPPGADDPAASELMLVRGGFGLSLFWAALVLERHGVRAWQRRDAAAAMGVIFPVVRV